jgi:hypothetical protein
LAFFKFEATWFIIFKDVFLVGEEQINPYVHISFAGRSMRHQVSSIVWKH